MNPMAWNMTACAEGGQRASYLLALLPPPEKRDEFLQSSGVSLCQVLSCSDPIELLLSCIILERLLHSNLTPANTNFCVSLLPQVLSRISCPEVESLGGRLVRRRPEGAAYFMLSEEENQLRNRPTGIVDVQESIMKITREYLKANENTHNSTVSRFLRETRVSFCAVLQCTSNEDLRTQVVSLLVGLTKGNPLHSSLLLTAIPEVAKDGLFPHRQHEQLQSHLAATCRLAIDQEEVLQAIQVHFEDGVHLAKNPKDGPPVEFLRMHAALRCFDTALLLAGSVANKKLQEKWTVLLVEDLCTCLEWKKDWPQLAQVVPSVVFLFPTNKLCSG